MTNEQLRALQKYIKVSTVIESLPVKIDNWREKLCGKGSRNQKRMFSKQDLALIESALLAIAHTINQNFYVTERTDTKA